MARSNRVKSLTSLAFVLSFLYVYFNLIAGGTSYIYSLYLQTLVQLLSLEVHVQCLALYSEGFRFPPQIKWGFFVTGSRYAFVTYTRHHRTIVQSLLSP